MRRNRRARTRHGTINAPGNQLLDIDIEDLSFTNLLLELREKPHDLLAIIERQRTTALNLQRQVVAEVYNNYTLRRDTSSLDQKISTLIKNKSDIEEVVKTSNHLQGLFDSSKRDGRNTRGKRGRHKSVHALQPKKRQGYGQLFYILISQPEYLAALTQCIDHYEIDGFLRTVVLTLFGDQFESREERSLLVLFQMVLRQEFAAAKAGSGMSSFMRRNSAITQMLSTYARRPGSLVSLKKILGSLLDEIIDDKDLDLEVNPVKIKAQILKSGGGTSGGATSAKGVNGSSGGALRKRVLSANSNTNEQPSEEDDMDPEVKAVVTKRVQKLLSICERFLDRLTNMESVKLVPYGIRWISQQIGMLATKTFPEATEQEINGLIGGFIWLRYFNPIIVAPDACNIVKNKPSRKARRNLILVAKVLQNLSNGVFFKEDSMKPMNMFIAEHNDRMSEYFEDICDVRDVKEFLAVDKYLEVTWAKTITITLNELYNMHRLLEKYIFFENGRAVVGRRLGSGQKAGVVGRGGGGTEGEGEGGAADSGRSAGRGERGLYGTRSSNSSVSSSSTTSSTGGSVFSRLRQYASQSAKDFESGPPSSAGNSTVGGNGGGGGLSGGILGQTASQAASPSSSQSDTRKSSGGTKLKNTKPVDDFALQSESNPVLTVGGERLLPRELDTSIIEPSLNFDIYVYKNSFNVMSCLKVIQQLGEAPKKLSRADDVEVQLQIEDPQRHKKAMRRLTVVGLKGAVDDAVASAEDAEDSEGDGPGGGGADGDDGDQGVSKKGMSAAVKREAVSHLLTVLSQLLYWMGLSAGENSTTERVLGWKEASGALPLIDERQRHSLAMPAVVEEEEHEDDGNEGRAHHAAATVATEKSALSGVVDDDMEIVDFLAMGKRRAVMVEDFLLAENIKTVEQKVKQLLAVNRLQIVSARQKADKEGIGGKGAGGSSARGRGASYNPFEQRVTARSFSGRGSVLDETTLPSMTEEQMLLLDLMKEIRRRDLEREKLVDHIKQLHAAMATLKDQKLSLELQLDYYRQYLRNIIQAKALGGARMGGLGQGSADDRKTRGPLAVIRTHVELEEEGVIVKSNVAMEVRNDVRFSFSPVQPEGCIEIKVSLQKFVALSTVISYESLLDRQQQGKNKLMIDDQVHFSVNMLLHFLQKHFR